MQYVKYVRECMLEDPVWAKNPKKLLTHFGLRDSSLFYCNHSHILVLSLYYITGIVINGSTVVSVLLLRRAEAL